jgi:hypothetical protein
MVHKLITHTLRCIGFDLLIFSHVINSYQVRTGESDPLSTNVILRTPHSLTHGNRFYIMDIGDRL